MLDASMTFLMQGLLDFPVWQIGLTLLIFTQLTIASVTIFLHRHQAHRGLDLHPAISHVFRFWLWLTTGMGTKEWVAVHRKHHAKCETEEDPHSPQVYGIRHLLLDGVDLYRKEAANAATLERYGHGTPDDWIERRLYARHKMLGISILLLVNVALFGILGLTMWAVQMMWIPIWAAGVINGLGHWSGYRNYETRDASTNIFPLGIWIGGEELHNNHHAFSSSAKFSMKWWEIDIGWWYIRLLVLLRLARVKKVAPRPLIEPEKDRIDVETLRAVVATRFQVMARYAKHVSLPVLRESLREMGSRRSSDFRRAKALLVRERSLLDDAARAQLERVLSGNRKLETVYQFRLRLQEIWGRAASNHDALIQALREWCAQAEATGIKALQDFARSLRGYSLQSG